MTVVFFFVCLVAILVIHGAMISVFSRSSRQKIAALSCVGGAVAAFLTLRVDPWPLAGFIALTASHVYFHFFNMSETARRIKLLMQIEAGEDPRRNYSSDLVVEKRVKRLLELNFIAWKDGKYHLRKKGLARVASLMRRYELWLFPERAAS